MIPHISDHSSAAPSVRAAAGFLLLAIVVITPWPFGTSNASGQLILALGILILMMLWAVYTVMTRQFTYRSDAISVCLLGLILFTALQLVPLPESVVRVLSPKAAEWHRSLLPETPELLPGEAPESVAHRSRWMKLSVAPSATEDLLVQFLALYLVYASARNFAGDGRSLQQLSWAGFATGTALALLAMTQYLSGDIESIYWTFNTGGPVFGPFVNKNHFAYQIHLFAGLSIGLFLKVAHREGLKSPLAIGLLSGMGLMLAAVGFSQSRGGLISLLAGAILTVIVARLTQKDRTAVDAERRIGLALFGGVAIITLALTAWLGWSTVIDRIASLWEGSADNRSEVWQRAWRLGKNFPLVGVGGGAYSVAELASRNQNDVSYTSVSAHNEYLEAAVEGGIVRCGLTIALAIVAIAAMVQNYRRTHDPLVLGCVFGLGAVAIHSIGDFGIHVPSVAIATAVVAAYGSRRQRVEEDEPKAKVRTRRPTPADRVGDAHSTSRQAEPAVLTGSAAYTAAGFFVFAAMLVVLANWRVYRVEVLRSAAQAAETEYAIRYLEALARLRPNDPETWGDLATAHLRAAAVQGEAALASVAGGIALIDTPDLFPRIDTEGHIAAAINAMRTGRDLQPLVPGPHMRLGAFADRLARTEPPSVHFGRAKLVGQAQPDVWYVCGKEAAERGDWPAALADWRESLSRSPRRLSLMAQAAASHVPPAEFRARALPDDPAIWFAATPYLFPETNDPERVAWLQAIAARSARVEPESMGGFTAWASALEELNDGPGAVRVWRRAVEHYPDDIRLRDRLAARLEAEEMYEEALPILEALSSLRPDGTYQNRLAAAKHALKLKAEINSR